MSKTDFKFKPKSTNQFLGVLFIAFFAIVGVYLLTNSHAATTYVSTSAGSGTVGCNASIQKDAQNNNYVKFGSGTTCQGGGGQGPGSFTMGLDVHDNNPQNAPVVKLTKPAVVRWEVGVSSLGISSPSDDCSKASGSYATSLVNLYAGMGSKSIALVDYGGTTSADMDKVARWAYCEKSNLVAIEFGNEDSYGYKYGDGAGQASYESRARNYANLTKEMGSQLQANGSGIGVVAQADDGNSGSADWVDTMFSTVPNLQSYVAGWTEHPYGPGYMARINRLATQVGAHVGGTGNVKPEYVTEYGLATDNGNSLTDNYGWPANMTYAQASSTINTVANTMAQSGKVALLIYYQSKDQKDHGASNGREYYFGVVQNNGTSSKDPLTSTIQSLNAQYH